VAIDGVWSALRVAPFPSQEGLSWEEAEPGLEDVFIHLMKGQAQ
jgi:hypothetical protein